MRATRTLDRTRHQARLWAAIYIALGALLVWRHRELPIVRNSLLYARTAYALLDASVPFDLARHSYSKALGFTLTSLPLVKWFGANVGFKIASWCWTSLWVASAIPFYRRFCGYFGAPAGSLLSYLVVLLLNPLVFYQFMSAYPDTMLAVAVLWSLYFMDRVVSRDCKTSDSVLFVVATVFALWVKHQGIILLGVLVLLVVMRWPLWRELVSRRRVTIYPGLGVAAIALAFAYGSRKSGHPLFNRFADTVPNLPQKVLHPTYLFSNLAELGLFLLLCFGVLIILVPPYRLSLRKDEPTLPWIGAALIYVGANVMYPGTTENVRHFLPICPILALVIISNLSRLEPLARTGLIALLVVTNSFAVLYYDSIDAHAVLRRLWTLPSVDNLRLTTSQADADQTIRAVNAAESAHPEPIVFMSGYYEDGSFEVWEKSGLFSTHPEIAYLHFRSRRNFPAAETIACKGGATSWIAYFYGVPREVMPPLADATVLGPEAFQLRCPN